MRIIDEKNVFPTFDIAIVVSRFNFEVTQKLYDGALARLQELNFNPDQITIAWVPGAVEIPLCAKVLATQKHLKAIVTLGAIIRGETDHYHYVCQQVSEGIQQVALHAHIPIIFGVLTTENEQQAFDRCGGVHGHKGREAIDAACEMVAVLKHLL
ncbi:MAG: 6,7-dimethyl-8-ribityllumazine synthase [Legionellales bacterium]|nr:6,7-dimethyl-8-ribityllumazine synthase [Legionellales bacterium]